MTGDARDPELRRVHVEIEAEAARLRDRPPLARRDPREAQALRADGIDRSRLDYRIGELTDPHHAAFVEHAFGALLKRKPDPDECAAQLRLLAQGTGKPELLGNLRYSPEGRAVGVRVRGLFARYASSKLRRVPLIGYLLDWALALAALPLMVRHQRAAEAMFSAADQAAAVAVERVAAEAERALRAHVARLDAADADTRASLDRTAHLVGEHLRTLDRATAALVEGQHAQARALDEAYRSLSDRYEEMSLLRQKLYSHNQWGHQLTDAFARIDDAASERRTRLDAFAARAASAVGADATRDARHAAWLDALARQLPASARVFALASAAEWPQRLARHGWSVLAIEPNRVLADAARADDIAVENVSYAAGLRRLADASAHAVTVLALRAVLRRLPIADLLDEARRILRPHGCLLLAFSREPSAIVDELMEPPAASPDAALLQAALTLAGFSSIERIDADDGTIALLGRSGSAE